MKISSIQNYYKMQAAANSANTKKTVEENNTSTENVSKTDTIDISAEASFKAELSQKAKAYAAGNTEETSSERIAELKQKYQGDTCPISGSEIAAKIIAGILGPNSGE